MIGYIIEDIVWLILKSIRARTNKGVISRVVDDTSRALEDSIVDLVDDGTLSEEDRRILKSNITIVDDERMPYYIRDGKRVYADVQLNASGSVRRLNPGQLVEVEANFIAEQVQYKIRNAKMLWEKEAILFKFLDCVNIDQGTFFKNVYNSYDATKVIDGVTIRFMSPAYKEAFIRDVEENGFYIVTPPQKPNHKQQNLHINLCSLMISFVCMIHSRISNLLISM